MGQAVLGSLSGLDLFVLAGSIIVVVGVGIAASLRKSETSDDYFLAGRSLPWWAIGMSFVATSVSSEQMIGTVGVTYEWGMAIANWEWFALPVYTNLLIFFLPVLLRNRITTVPEYFRQRFSPACGDVYSWVMLFAYVFLFTVTVLYSGTLAFAEITGWNFYVVLWLMAISVGVYTVRGGMKSVIWTTVLQCALLLIGGTILFFIALDKIPGGWSAMVEANPDRFHLYQPADHPKAPFLGMVFASFGVFLFYQVGNQYMIQRILCARSMWDGLMGILLSGFINFLRPMTTCLLGLVVFHWIHEMKMAEPLENLDTAFPFALKAFSPEWGLRGFILSGFLAAVMSTLSSLVNSTSTLFALDVYKKSINTSASESETVRAGKIAALLSLVISAALAPAVFHLGGIFTFFQTGVTYLASPFIATFIMGLLWKRTNATGALFGLTGGLAIQIAVGLGAPLAGLEIHWLYLACIGQVLVMISVAVVSLATAAPNTDQIGALVWSRALLRQYEAESPRPWYAQIKLWFALYAAAWCGIYYWFW